VFITGEKAGRRRKPKAVSKDMSLDDVMNGVFQNNEKINIDGEISIDDARKRAKVFECLIISI
jgi:hypothetical protein